MSAKLHLSPRACTETTSPATKRLSVLAILLIAGYCVFATFGASRAIGDVGDLGPPPAVPEIQQAITDLYAAAAPLGSTVDVQFDGPIMVGSATEHANPPPQPWCVRCGYPDQGSSLMYPVLTLVRVTTTYGQQSSAVTPANPVDTTTYNGMLCPGVDKPLVCTAYYFYRDGQGNWQVA